MLTFPIILWCELKHHQSVHKWDPKTGNYFEFNHVLFGELYLNCTLGYPRYQRGNVVLVLSFRPDAHSRPWLFFTYSLLQDSQGFAITSLTSLLESSSTGVLSLFYPCFPFPAEISFLARPDSPFLVNPQCFCFLTACLSFIFFWVSPFLPGSRCFSLLTLPYFFCFCQCDLTL